MKQDSGYKLRFFAMLLLGLSIAGYGLAAMLSLDSGGNVALIQVHGTIGIAQPMQAGLNPDSIIELIDKAEDTPGIMAVVFDINSRGGAPVASQRIVERIQALNKTSVAVIRDTGASSGYWIASACDYVIASKYSVTGSIGVYGSYIGYYGLMDDYNVSYERYVGGELKDMGSPFKQPSELEAQVLRGKVRVMHELFLKDIQQNRNLSDLQLSQVASGTILLGQEAFELGLVDEVGGDRELELYLEQELGTGRVAMQKLKPRQGLLEGLLSMLSKAPLGVQAETAQLQLT
jgi:protease IV